MPNNLEKLVSQLLTMQEASLWVEQRLEEYGLGQAPRPNTLKKAACSGRLEAVLKGGMYFTRAAELKEFMKDYDPRAWGKN